MKKFIIFLFLANFLYSNILSTNQENFLKACQLYEHGKFEESIKMFEAVSNKGLEEFFNIGNCYYMLENYVTAICYWKRALKYAHFKDFEKINKNIEKAAEKLKIDFCDDEFLYNVLMFFIKYASLFSFFFLQVIIIIFSYMLIFYYLFNFRLKYFIPVILFCNFIFISMFGAKYLHKNIRKGVVISECNLHAGPDNDFHIINNVKLLNNIKILDESSNWIKIKTGDNIIGWTEKKSIFIL